MGKGQSKEIEEEQININVPVNSPHLAGDKYEVHQYHGGTVKAILIIMLVLFMALILCVIAVKRLCRNMRYLGNNEATPTVVYTKSTEATPTVVYSKKSHFPDV